VQQWKEVQALLWKMTALAFEFDHAWRTGPNKAFTAERKKRASAE
jgi:hypothetical protein